MSQVILVYRLIKTTRRLTFEILEQHPSVTYMGDDDGLYFKFVASNGYEVISRSRMDIQTERLWLRGAKSLDEERSGTMVFYSNEKRDTAYCEFIKALDEWATHHGGIAQLADMTVPQHEAARKDALDRTPAAGPTIENLLAGIYAVARYIGPKCVANMERALYKSMAQTSGGA